MEEIKPEAEEIKLWFDNRKTDQPMQLGSHTETYFYGSFSA